MSEEERKSIKVVKLLDEYKIVINKGASDGIKLGQVFLVYKEDEELFDPDTNESLGRLEIVKGKGKVVHLQTKMATVDSISKKIIITNRSILFGGNSTTEEGVPFDNVQIGDLVKPI